jgi:hypothetical protein
MSRSVFSWTVKDFDVLVTELLGLPASAKVNVPYLTELLISSDKSKYFEYIKNLSQRYVDKGWKLPHYIKKSGEEKLWKIAVAAPLPPTAKPVPILKQKINPDTLCQYIIDGEFDLFRHFWSIASNQDEIVSWEDYYIPRYCFYSRNELACIFDKWTLSITKLREYQRVYGVLC